MKVQNNLKLSSIPGGEVTRYPFVSFSREKARGSFPPQLFLYTPAITQARTLKNNLGKYRKCSNNLSPYGLL